MQIRTNANSSLGNILRLRVCQLHTRKQGGVSISTMEADFTAASIVVAEMIVIKELLGEMSLDCVIPMLLKVDMKQLSSNLTESLHQKQNTLT